MKLWNWSFVNISLFLICLTIVKDSSSTLRIESSSHNLTFKEVVPWLKPMSKHRNEKQRQRLNPNPVSSNGDVKDKEKRKYNNIIAKNDLTSLRTDIYNQPRASEVGEMFNKLAEEKKSHKRIVSGHRIRKREINATGCQVPYSPTCSKENSCKGRCTNHTEWRTELKLYCYCDPDCYLVFRDCCSDYVRFCGAQRPRQTLTTKYHYTCEGIGHRYHENGDRSVSCVIGDGVFMVARCPPEYRNTTLRNKCEAPVNSLTRSSQDLYRYLPVLGDDNTTFRNKYCAMCNGVVRYEPWSLKCFTTTNASANYKIMEKIDFLLSKCAEFGALQPDKKQVR